MVLSRFDLIVIKDALMSIVQTYGKETEYRKGAYQSTESAIANILTEYPITYAFLVQPDESEEWE